MYPSMHEMEAQLANLDTSALQPLRVQVLRNVMVEPIAPYMRYLTCQSGYDLNLGFGEFDNVFQEAVGGAPALREEGLDAVMLFTRLEGLSWDLARNFPALSEQAVDEEVRRLGDFFSAVIQGLRAQTDAMILWCGMEPPVHPALGIADAQNGTGQSAAVEKVNQALRKALSATSNAYCLDMGNCLARVGANRFYDQRFWHIGRAPYTREALGEIAHESLKFFRALKGKNKKCLILDCDNTLWGGIVGEDGLAGIKLARTHPGSAFHEFQQEILGLANRGIILALCSKNNEDDVWEVFDNHPDMVLKREHIAAWRINWQDKAANIRELARDLSIGLDSMVFVDDSPFEAELVRTELPEVEVVHLPKEKPIEYRDMLAACGLFDTLTLTAEDKKRGAMYRAEACRRRASSQATNMIDFYRSLEMEVEIGLADEFTIPRIAQQTQKTNQFNLTTRRYSERDIERLAKADDSDVMWMRVMDRFGDSGIVGSCILRYAEYRAEFDSFLLSCRVLGRDVERVFLAHALMRARDQGASFAEGVWLKTAKNSQVKTFFSDNGFTEDTEHSSAEERYFHLPLDGYSPPDFDHFKSITSYIPEG